MKGLIVIMVSMLMVACGGSGDGGSGGSVGGGIDSNLGTYSAEIKNSGGTVVRSFNILVETDQNTTIGVPENVPFYQFRDEDNIFSRYRYMRFTTGIFLTGDYESEAIQSTTGQFDSLVDCLDNVTGTGSTYKRLIINSPKYSGGGTGTSLAACKAL